MIVEAGRDADAAKWLADRRFEFVPPFVTLVLSDRGKICAVAVFNNYQQSNIDLSVVTDGPVPLTRSHLRALFSYPFRQLGVNRVTATTSQSFKDVRVLIRRLGFKMEGRHPQFYGDDAAISFGMTRAQCKWI